MYDKFYEYGRYDGNIKVRFSGNQIALYRNGKIEVKGIKNINNYMRIHYILATK